MEMLVSLLLSVNKISLIGFFITLIFILYQVYLLVKEIKARETAIVIPEFKETMVKPISTSSNQPISDNKKKVYRRSIFTNLIAGLILLFVFGLIVLFGLLKKQTKESINLITPTPMINLLVSPGIKIYNENWEEISDKELTNLKPGMKIIVGVETIAGLDVDMARIRINKNNWDKETITVRFNEEKKVFYREYEISSQEAYLKIEAQLHSQTDGWLGD